MTLIARLRRTWTHHGVSGVLCFARRAGAPSLSDVLCVAAGFELGAQAGNILMLWNVDGPSMEPTVYAGSVLVGTSLWCHAVWARYFGSQRDEWDFAEGLVDRVVMCHIAALNQPALCKRVGAVRGPHSSPRVDLRGDNANQSYDSRAFGPLPLSCVACVVHAVVWPPSQWKWL
jgi:hypothetical protein